MSVSRYGIVLRAAPCLSGSAIKLAHAINSTVRVLYCLQNVDKHLFKPIIVLSSAKLF